MQLHDGGHLLILLSCTSQLYYQLYYCHSYQSMPVWLYCLMILFLCVLTSMCFMHITDVFVFIAVLYMCLTCINKRWFDLNVAVVWWKRSAQFMCCVARMCMSCKTLYHLLTCQCLYHTMMSTWKICQCGGVDCGCVVAEFITQWLWSRVKAVHRRTFLSISRLPQIRTELVQTRWTTQGFNIFTVSYPSIPGSAKSGPRANEVAVFVHCRDWHYVTGRRPYTLGCAFWLSLRSMMITIAPDVIVIGADL